MTDAPDAYPATDPFADQRPDEPIEVVTGEVVDAEAPVAVGAGAGVVTGPDGDERPAPELIDLDDDAVLAEVDEADDTDRATDDPDAGDVLVLDTWQIAIPATGDAKVDAALARLVDVEGLPPTEHADVYEVVHAGLHDALADLDRP